METVPHAEHKRCRRAVVFGYRAHGDDFIKTAYPMQAWTVKLTLKLIAALS